MRRFSAVVGVLGVFAAGCSPTVEGAPVTGSDRGVSTTSSTPAPPAEPAVAATDLPGLVLSGAELEDLMHAPEMTKEMTWSAPERAEGMTVDPAECTGSLFGGMAASYDGGGYRAFFMVGRAQQDGRRVVQEGLATFADAASAQRFVAKSVGRWRDCAGKRVTQTSPGVEVIWTAGQVAPSGAVTTIDNTVVVMPTFHQVRALAAKANVVVDLQVTGYDLTDEATTIATRILDRIPG